MSNVGQILNENLNFRCHLSTFRAENTLKSGTLQTENMPKHFLNHFGAIHILRHIEGEEERISQI